MGVAARTITSPFWSRSAVAAIRRMQAMTSELTDDRTALVDGPPAPASTTGGVGSCRRRSASRSGGGRLPIAVTLLAAVLRLVGLGHPHSLVFDETYYVKDGWSIVHLGYEGTWPANPSDDGAPTTDQRFADGETDLYSRAASSSRTRAAREVPDRPRHAAVRRRQLVRVAVHGRRARHRDRVPDRGHRALAVPLDGDRERSPGSCSRSTAGDRAVARDAARRHPDVLRRARSGALLLDRRWTQRRLDDWVRRRAGYDGRDTPLGAGAGLAAVARRDGRRARSGVATKLVRPCTSWRSSRCTPC